MMEHYEANEIAALQRFRADVLSAVRRLDEELDRLRPVGTNHTQPATPASEMGLSTEPGVSAVQDVLVRRTPGPTVEVFHSAGRPCGRVRRKGGSLGAFKITSYSRALKQGLRACSACDFSESTPEVRLGGRP